MLKVQSYIAAFSSIGEVTEAIDRFKMYKFCRIILPRTCCSCFMDENSGRGLSRSQFEIVVRTPNVVCPASI